MNEIRKSEITAKDINNSKELKRSLAKKDTNIYTITIGETELHTEENIKSEYQDLFLTSSPW